MNQPIEIAIGSILGVVGLFYVGLYYTKRKTEQRQNGLILPRQESPPRNSLVNYDDGFDLPNNGSTNPNDFRNLLYGGKTKSKKQSKKQSKRKKNK
jgi:Tfp pilus assembly protein PilN